MEFEVAHSSFIEAHTNVRTGERRGGCCADITLRRSCFCRMYGGRYSSHWSICTRNMRCMTGTGSRSFWILPLCHRMEHASESNVTVIRAILRIWTGRSSTMRLTGIPS